MRTSNRISNDDAWRRGLIKRLEALESDLADPATMTQADAAQGSIAASHGLMGRPAPGVDTGLSTGNPSREVRVGALPMRGGAHAPMRQVPDNFQKALEDALRGSAAQSTLVNIDAALAAVTTELGRFEAATPPVASRPCDLSPPPPDQRLSVNESDTLEELQSAVEAARSASGQAMKRVRNVSLGVATGMIVVAGAWSVQHVRSPDGVANAARPGGVTLAGAAVTPKLFDAHFKPAAADGANLQPALEREGDASEPTPRLWQVRAIATDAGAAPAVAVLEIERAGSISAGSADEPASGSSIGLPIALRWNEATPARHVSLVVWHVPEGARVSPAARHESGAWIAAGADASRLRIDLGGETGAVALVIDAIDQTGRVLARSEATLPVGHELDPARAAEVVPSPILVAAAPGPAALPEQAPVAVQAKVPVRPDAADAPARRVDAQVEPRINARRPVVAKAVAVAPPAVVRSGSQQPALPQRAQSKSGAQGAAGSGIVRQPDVRPAEAAAAGGKSVHALLRPVPKAPRPRGAVALGGPIDGAHGVPHPAPAGQVSASPSVYVAPPAPRQGQPSWIPRPDQ